MSYEDALAWLFTQTRAHAPRDPARTRALLSDLGLAPPPNAVHVVGTNGKGTVAYLVSRGFSLAGQRTGLFISPHVEDFRERISVDDEPISKGEVLEFVTRAQALPGRYAFFELCFALASLHFARCGVQTSVIEAGVGARNDATRVLEDVRTTVITNVSLDHRDTLGDTAEAIARDKAEAIRPGVPTFTAAGGEALAVIREVAAARSASLHVLADTDPLFDLPATLALGYRHPDNLRLAAAVLRGSGLEEGAVAAALSAPPLPGRREPFTLGATEVILDGGHNPAAAEALLATLDEPFVLVFGALEKKQGAETLSVLERRALETVLTRAAGQIDPRLLGPGLLDARRRFVPDPLEALHYALKHCPEGASVVIAGSLYLAGELRPHLRRLSSSPAAGDP